MEEEEGEGRERSKGGGGGSELGRACQWKQRANVSQSVINARQLLNICPLPQEAVTTLLFSVQVKMM